MNCTPYERECTVMKFHAQDANTSRHGKHHVKVAFRKVLHCITKGTEIVDKKLLEASIKKREESR